MVPVRMDYVVAPMDSVELGMNTAQLPPQQHLKVLVKEVSVVHAQTDYAVALMDSVELE